jgi:hypothetical protein
LTSALIPPQEATLVAFAQQLADVAPASTLGIATAIPSKVVTAAAGTNHRKTLTLRICFYSFPSSEHTSADHERRRRQASIAFLEYPLLWLYEDVAKIYLSRFSSSTKHPFV